MKTIEQVISYISQCEFPNSDWPLVQDYCKEHFGGRNVSRARNPLYVSTYRQFTEWVDSGFGPGDIVRYGHTVGIVSTSVPDIAILAAYCDFEGNLITRNLQIFPSKILPLEDKPAQEFRELMFKNGVDFSVKDGKIVKVYTPKNFSYVSFKLDGSTSVSTGLLLGSDGCEYHFSALLIDNTLYIDHKIELRCTPLKKATLKEVQKLHSKASRLGWALEGRKHTFVRKSERNPKGKYWYITDRFTVTADKDSGTAKHDARFEAGNYFTDETEAVLFARDLVMRRKEEQ